MSAMAAFGSRPSSRLEFARKFLAENRRLVFFAAFAQVFIVRYAAQERWLLCALNVVWLAALVWALVQRAAGIPEPVTRPKSREEMTPREAFWLDPSTVLERKRSGHPS